MRGVKLLYDSFFKEVMNPEYDAGRLEDFLSELLKQRVKIVKVLPNDSVRIAMENSMLITDLVVQLADGSLANIEIQKIGYMFPGERASCYSADLLLPQYKRIRDERKKKFLHSIETKSDSGISLNLLPEDVIRLISDYTQFKPMYDEMYQMCLNTEKIMGLFSKELQILDENTVQYMMDEMQDTINEKQSMIHAMHEQLGEKDCIIADRDSVIAEKDATIQHLQKRIKELEAGQK